MRPRDAVVHSLAVLDLVNQNQEVLAVSSVKGFSACKGLVPLFLVLLQY